MKPARLASGCPRPASTQDETFTGRPLPRSRWTPRGNFINLEQLAQARLRSYITTWDEISLMAPQSPGAAQVPGDPSPPVMKPRTIGLCANTISRRTTHPTYYMCSTELVNAVSGPMATRDWAALKAVTEATAQLELLQSDPQSPGDESVPSRMPRKEPVRLLWSGVTAGQGWGINPDFGGMKIYEAMRQTQPDFSSTVVTLFTLINGGPIAASVPAENGQFVAQYCHPKCPKSLKRWLSSAAAADTTCWLSMSVASTRKCRKFWQWDDHEVVNNWSDSRIYPVIPAIPRKTCHY